MLNYKIMKLKEHPELKTIFAKWFHEKWKVPLDAYLDSMDVCLDDSSVIPNWYGIMQQTKMIAGVGVIENDFHERKDLAPNLCALYVEEDYRCRGIAGKLLDFVCNDMNDQGITTLYLITDHTSFYERYNWEYVCMGQCDSELTKSRIYRHNYL